MKFTNFTNYKLFEDLIWRKIIRSHSHLRTCNLSIHKISLVDTLFKGSLHSFIYHYKTFPSSKWSKTFVQCCTLSQRASSERISNIGLHRQLVIYCTKDLSSIFTFIRNNEIFPFNKWSKTFVGTVPYTYKGGFFRKNLKYLIALSVDNLLYKRVLEYFYIHS